MTMGDVAKMVRMWNDGMKGKHIAEALGISEQSVHNYVSIHRGMFQYRHHFITDAELDVMRGLWMDGASAKSIATAMGMTIGSVKGYIERRRDVFPQRRRHHDQG